MEKEKTLTDLLTDLELSVHRCRKVYAHETTDRIEAEIESDKQQSTISNLQIKNDKQQRTIRLLHREVRRLKREIKSNMKKIMFSDKFSLTAAVLNGTKTQIRRIINAMPKDPKIVYGLEEEAGYVHLLDGYIVVEKSRYRVGEVVAVAMPYKDFYGDFKEPLRTELVDSVGFYNKMFVKAEYMPYKIEITNVRVQRLQDISDEDCLAEGIIKYADGVYTYYENGKKYYHANLDTPQKAFADLIDRINGKVTWETNPFVYVYEFKLIKK